MLIKDLPPDLRDLAYKRRKEYNLHNYENIEVLEAAFTWDETEEKHTFWRDVNNGIITTINKKPMTTNVIILGETPEKKDLKPIEFVKYLNTKLEIVNKNIAKPENWKNIEIVCRNYGRGPGLDLMLAYDDDRNEGCLYLGHANDCIV